MARPQNRKSQRAQDPLLDEILPEKKSRSSHVLHKPREQHLESSKRPHPDDSLSANCEKPPKKQKRSDPTILPPSFWDNLSTIPLEKSALEELERRNIATAGAPQPRIQVQRPVTRRFSAEIERAAKLELLDRSIRTGKHGHIPPRTVAEQAAGLGGPNLSDLRGCREPWCITEGKMSSIASSLIGRKRGSTSSLSKNGTPSTATTQSTTPYSRAFLQHLIDHGILPDGYEYPDGRVPPEPDNIEEIRAALAVPLSSTSFTQDDFKRFKRADTQASKQRQVTTSVIPIIQGDIGDSRRVAGEIPWKNLEPLTDGSLAPANPDLYYGARPEQLSREVRAALKGYIVPSTQQDLPIVPTFVTAIKGPDGLFAVALRQALYDATICARGRLTLDSHGVSEVIYDNKAYVIVSIYHSGQLRMYTVHPIRPTVPGARPDYVMTQIDAYAMTGSFNACRQGAAAYRNGVQWTKVQTDAAIKQANARAAKMKTSVEENALTVEERQDAGSSPVNFFDCLPFPEPDDEDEEAQEAKETDVGLGIHHANDKDDVETEDSTDIATSFASSFTSVSHDAPLRSSNPKLRDPPSPSFRRPGKRRAHSQSTKPP